MKAPSTPVAASECRMTLDGVCMRYLLCRSAARQCPPRLLIHGLLGYSFSWRLNINALARDADVYAVDLPGLGFSDRPQQMDRSAEGLARYLLRFLDALGIVEVDVIGTSHGGGLAIMLAAIAPARVRRLVLVAPVNPWSNHGDWLTRVLTTTAGGLALRCVAPGIWPVNGYVLRRLYGDPKRIPAGTLAGYRSPLRTPGTIAHLLAILRSWHSDLREFEAALPRIADIRTLLIWGSRDRAVLPSSAEPLRRRFENAELVMLDGVGHLPYEEAPDEFNRAVTGFLKDE
jgi:pimeloyl-ACP methyl ester carboxylesterase